MHSCDVAHPSHAPPNGLTQAICLSKPQNSGALLAKVIHHKRRTARGDRLDSGFV